MQKAKKQLFGFGGLAFVVALTSFATTLPTGAVSSTTGDVQVMVQVFDANYSTTINSPLDSKVYNTAEIDFSETHSHAYRVDYVLQRLNTDGTVAETFNLDDYTVIGEDVSGNTDFTLNMDNYGGPATYVFRSTITSEFGSKKEDAVQFIYAGISADEKDVEASATKVDFDVNYSAGVKSITYVLKDREGNELTMTFVTNTPDPENGGTIKISLDLTELGLENGDYTIFITGYEGLDGQGEIVDSVSISFKYEVPPVVPNVPDTGSLLNALNISQSDFLITGLICFVVISGIALVVIKRARRQNQ